MYCIASSATVQATCQTTVQASAAHASLKTPGQDVSQPQTHVHFQSTIDKYWYKVKIMNSTNSEVIVRQLNNLTSKFKSIKDI